MTGRAQCSSPDLTLLYSDARTGGSVTRTVSSACVLRPGSPPEMVGVTRPAASVPAGGTLPGDSVTPALQDTTTILTASVRTSLVHFLSFQDFIIFQRSSFSLHASFLFH